GRAQSGGTPRPVCRDCSAGVKRFSSKYFGQLFVRAGEQLSHLLRSLPGFESGRTGAFIAAGTVRSDRACPATWLEIARHRRAGKNVIELVAPIPVEQLAILSVGRRRACPTILSGSKNPRDCKAGHVERAK